MNHLSQHLAWIRQRKLTAAIICCLILGCSIASYALAQPYHYPGTVWLPSNAATAGDEYAMLDLITSNHEVKTGYGKALHYASTTYDTEGVKQSDNSSFITIYAFKPSNQLRIQDCPNIKNVEAVLPSGCEHIGRFAGGEAYAINRRLPSGAAEYYFQHDGVFMYVMQGGDGGSSISYLKDYEPLPRRLADKRVATDNKRVEVYAASLRAEVAATKHRQATSYQHLAFTPLLPKNVPAGWRLDTKLLLSGSDTEHPDTVRMVYRDKHDHFIDYYVRPLAGFNLGAGRRCGPMPYGLTDPDDCFQPVGSTGYQTMWFDGANTFYYYKFQQVGDLLVITTQNTPNSVTKEGLLQMPVEAAHAQDSLMQGTVAATEDQLKNSTFIDQDNSL